MRPYPLTVLGGGINRLRVKGGAAANMLYDLQNGYITNAGSIVPREGTLIAQVLDSSTVGLAAANGHFNIFSSAFSTAALPANYVLNVLSDPNDTTQPVTKIWFAKPFMGFEYIVAQFGNGDIFHYWLQNAGTWTSSTDYTSASIVLPPVANGLAYQGIRDFPPQPLWTAETVVSSGSYVEPNTPTGFVYQAVATTGSPVHTGAVEPVWPTIAGGILQEFGDFDVSSTDAGTTQLTNGQITTATGLGSNITDRYGNSATVSNAGIFSPTSTLSTLTLASTKVNPWTPGTNYAPGAVVTPTSSQGAFTNAIPNGDFEGGGGAGGWTFTNPGGSATWAYSGALPYQGAESLAVAGGTTMGASGAQATMTSYSLVTPGQQVTASAYVNPNNNGANLTVWIQLNWYNSGDTFISNSGFEVNEAEGFGYRKISVTGTAPAGAAHVRVAIGAGAGTTSRNAGYVDLVTWSLETPAPITNFLFEAVQAAAASSAATEPTWPTVLGNTVIDGGVTWKAIGTSIITWQAIPIMQSGLTVPTFPTIIGNSVMDYSTYSNINGYITTLSSMSWAATDRHISDIKNPNTKVVVIGASHVFAADNDIVDYSAAVNPVDWSSSNNAGYLPTGLNNYGDNPVAALALYRGNLIAFNAGGYQMWQIDPDPQNMAFLDAQPVGSTFTRAAQSVANDLLFLTEVGVRNLGTIGATANMAIGNTGQPVDPLIKAALQAGTYEPISLYYPGRGQYWLIFGPQAFVLTINGANGTKSWSRYIFPDIITDWTLNGGNLYLRTAGNLVWQLDANTASDSYVASGTRVFSSSTVLLLHMDTASLIVGQYHTPDASYLLGDATINTGMLTTGTLTTGILSTFTPMFGPQCFETNGTLLFSSYAMAMPFTTGSPVDIFATNNWTIEGWFLIPIATGSTYLIDYGGSKAGGVTSDMVISAATDGAGNTLVSAYDYAAFGTGVTLTKSLPAPPGTWHHFALVNNAGSQNVYLDGFPTGLPRTDWIPANYGSAGIKNVVVGSFSRFNGTTTPNCLIDEIRVSSVARYTTTFTPPSMAAGTAPFDTTVTTGVPFDGVVQWPYMDMGALGLNKMMVGVDLVGEGDCFIQMAYDQSDKTTFNDNALFSTSGHVTAPYFIAVDDTVPGEPLPIPINAPSYSLILRFPGNVTTANNWSWEAANLYISDGKGAGSTG